MSSCSLLSCRAPPLSCPQVFLRTRSCSPSVVSLVCSPRSRPCPGPCPSVRVPVVVRFCLSVFVRPAFLSPLPFLLICRWLVAPHAAPPSRIGTRPYDIYPSAYHTYSTSRRPARPPASPLSLCLFHMCVQYLSAHRCRR
ncbi:hypothetical protein BD413DRAFT_569449 [Trametes elegans]|nr:hypothetical protein BD413DRAFT_569449 [Trametes elegans]